MTENPKEQAGRKKCPMHLLSPSAMRETALDLRIVETPKTSLFRDITGERFESIEVLGYAGVKIHPSGQRKSMWLCRCDCGKVFVVSGNNLKRKNTTCCGCKRKTHGMTGSAEHVAWVSAIQRCTNPNNPGYKNYGARGIRVCERWMSFENFISDMGPRPRKHSLDRIDNDGDYEPGNCRWTTNKTQHRNKRTNSLVTIRGETKCVSEWAEIAGMSANGFRKRLNTGFPEELLLNPPIGRSELVRIRELRKLRKL